MLWLQSLLQHRRSLISTFWKTYNPQQMESSGKGQFSHGRSGFFHAKLKTTCVVNVAFVNLRKYLCGNHMKSWCDNCKSILEDEEISEDFGFHLDKGKSPLAIPEMLWVYMILSVGCTACFEVNICVKCEWEESLLFVLHAGCLGYHEERGWTMEISTRIRWSAPEGTRSWSPSKRPREYSA